MKNCEYQQIDPRALRASSTLSCGRKNSQRLRRKWEVFPGNNRFYCDGRIMLASQCGVLPLTIGLIFITSGLFLTFDCPFLVEHLTVFIPVIAGVLFLFVVISLLQTSLTDPGILPRALPDEAADIERQIDNSGSSTYRPPPRTKEILINDQVVKLKYCFTCKMFRPPRTSHCSLCDNCVERFDHHCPWVGNCVGKRNYRLFYTFIVSLSFLTSFIFGCVITHLTLRSQGGKGIIQAIQESPARYPFYCVHTIFSLTDMLVFKPHKACPQKHTIAKLTEFTICLQACCCTEGSAFFLIPFILNRLKHSTTPYFPLNMAKVAPRYIFHEKQCTGFQRPGVYDLRSWVTSTACQVLFEK